jgi:hypothetical protein
MRNMRNAKTRLAEKCEKMVSLEQPTFSHNDNIKTDIKEKAVML